MYFKSIKRPDLPGKPVLNSINLFPSKDIIHFEGNCHIFTEYMKNKTVFPPKFAYFGDQYTTDVYFASQIENWDAFAIIEELTQVDGFNEI